MEPLGKRRKYIIGALSIRTQKPFMAVWARAHVEKMATNINANGNELPPKEEDVKIEQDEKRLFPDDLNLGNLTAMDFISCEGMLMCLKQVIEQLPPKTYENLPSRWASIFVDGMDDIREFRKIADIQLKKSEEAPKTEPDVILPEKAKQLLKWLNKDWAIWKPEHIFLPPKIESNITGKPTTAEFALVFDDCSCYDLFYIYHSKIIKWAENNELFMEQYNSWNALFYKENKEI